MMQKRVKVLVLYGGQSVEHEVSCCSASFLFKHIDQTRFELHAVGITRDGAWIPQQTNALLDSPPNKIPIAASKSAFEPSSLNPVVSPGDFIRSLVRNGADQSSSEEALVVFPLVHGSFGEDGTLQGFLELSQLPYVGSGTLGSAAAMDKHIAKTLVQAAGIPVVPWTTVRRQQWQETQSAAIEEAEAAFGYPMFVKPACLGSSVGISKAHNRAELISACDLAFRYDFKILIETSIENARELESATLGGFNPECAGPGEVIPHQGFYSYDAKYISKDGASLQVPAQIPEELAQKVREMSVNISNCLELYGMARIDLFYSESEQKLYFNEANTIPGFTDISQYPMIWKNAGISGTRLLTRLIESAQERFSIASQFERDYTEGQKA